MRFYWTNPNRYSVTMQNLSNYSGFVYWSVIRTKMRLWPACVQPCVVRYGLRRSYTDNEVYSTNLPQRRALFFLFCFVLAETYLRYKGTTSSFELCLDKSVYKADLHISYATITLCQLIIGLAYTQNLFSSPDVTCFTTLFQAIPFDMLSWSCRRLQTNFSFLKNVAHIR